MVHHMDKSPLVEVLGSLTSNMVAHENTELGDMVMVCVLIWE